MKKRGVRSVMVLLAGIVAATVARAAGSAWDRSQGWESSPIGKGTLINLAATPAASYCPQNKYVVGVEIRSGTLVDALRVECARLGPNGEHLELDGATGWIGNRSGGNVSMSRCASGEVIVAARGRAGDYIDQVSFGCRKWSATQGLHGPIRWLPARGGNGGQPAGPVECLGERAVTTLVGAAHSYVARFIVVCHSTPPKQQAGAGSSSGSSSGGSVTSPGGGSTATPTVPRSTQLPVTRVPQPVAPVLTKLSMRQLSGGSVELTIDGEHFAAGEISRVEVGGTAVSYRVVSPTRVVATVPQHVWTKIDPHNVPVVITSGGKRISKQLSTR